MSPRTICLTIPALTVLGLAVARPDPPPVLKTEHFDRDPGWDAFSNRLAVRMITTHNRSCGTFVTPFTPGGYRPTPVKNDGTRYHWTLTYDPAAASGRGQFRFTIRSNAAVHEPWEGKEFTVDLPEEV